MTEIHKKYRPKTLNDVVGQAEAVAALRRMVKTGLPHEILLTGASGVGKTSIARILAAEVGCSDVLLSMVPCARIDKPLEAVQEIAQSCRYGTDLNGKPRVYVMDEFQSLSRARFAQEAMLDVLEQDDRKAYFFLCSTDPQKILKTIRGRCVRIHLRPIPEDTLAELVTRVAAAEGIKLARGVADRAAGQAGGSAREALKALERLRGLAGAGQMAELVPPEAEAQAFNLVKVLTPFKGRPSPKAVCKILESLEGHDPEEIRRLVLACARRQLLRCDHTSARAYLVIQAFRDTLYSGGQADHAVLAAMAWEVCQRGGEG